MIRNAQMAHYADQLILIYDGESKGSQNMLDTMKRAGKPFFILFVEFIRGHWYEADE